jgi:hypothetical protein
MSEPKSLLDRALDVMVFAPLGLAADEAELSKLAEKGRRRVEPQMAIAKVVGRFAFAQLQREVERQVTETAARVQLLFGGGRTTPEDEDTTLGRAMLDLDTADPRGPARPDADAPGPHGAPEGAGGTGTTATPPGERRRSAGRRPRPAHPGDEGPGAGSSSDLAIHGYDALSAPQVVQRLAGLSQEELEAVRVYETATRGRRTILARIAQLQAGAAG